MSSCFGMCKNLRTVDGLDWAELHRKELEVQEMGLRVEMMN